MRSIFSGVEFVTSDPNTTYSSEPATQLTPAEINLLFTKIFAGSTYNIQYPAKNTNARFYQQGNNLIAEAIDLSHADADKVLALELDYALSFLSSNTSNCATIPLSCTLKHVESIVNNLPDAKPLRQGIADLHNMLDADTKDILSTLYSKLPDASALDPTDYIEGYMPGFMAKASAAQQEKHWLTLHITANCHANGRTSFNLQLIDSKAQRVITRAALADLQTHINCLIFNLNQAAANIDDSSVEQPETEISAMPFIANSTLEDDQEYVKCDDNMLAPVAEFTIIYLGHQAITDSVSGGYFSILLTLTLTFGQKLRDILNIKPESYYSAETSSNWLTPNLIQTIRTAMREDVGINDLNNYLNSITEAKRPDLGLDT